MNKGILNNGISLAPVIFFAPKFNGLNILLWSWFLLVQEFRQGIEGMAYVCSMMCGASAKTTQHLGVTWWIGLGIIIIPCLVFAAGCGLDPHLGIWNKFGFSMWLGLAHSMVSMVSPQHGDIKSGTSPMVSQGFSVSVVGSCTFFTLDVSSVT